LIDICLHGHVRVCEYFEYNCEYCVRVGVATVIVFVTLAKDVYKRRIINDMMSNTMNNFVDIRWVLS
jgi:hypothetical protein